MSENRDTVITTKTRPTFQTGAASAEQSVGVAVNDTVTVTVVAGQLIILMICHFSANVTSVTDTALNTYTNRVAISSATSPGLDVYTATAKTTGSITITVVYDSGHDSGLNVGAYSNTSGLGAIASNQNITTFTSPQTFSITTTDAKSLIVYGVEPEQPGITCLKPFTPSAGQTDREVLGDPGGVCANAIVPSVMGELPATLAGSNSFTESWSAATTRGDIFAIELLPLTVKSLKTPDVVNAPPHAYHVNALSNPYRYPWGRRARTLPPGHSPRLFFPALTGDVPEFSRLLLQRR